MSVANKLLDILSSESRWTQRTYAKDQFGIHVMPDDPTAVCWCLAGALEKLMQYDEISTNEYLDFTMDFMTQTGQSKEKFNDSHTFEELTDALRSF